MSANDPQPAPQPGEAPASVDLVVVDLAERKRHGVAKYGVAHQFDNGRDHCVDAYQEALDLSVYLRAEIEKRQRMVALVRIVRSAENSAPLRELLDLIEAGHG